MPTKRVIHWFRQDLRLLDNPALLEAVNSGIVLPIYIIDEKNPGKHGLGRGSVSWLHQSLISLNNSLLGKLSIYKGDPKDILYQTAVTFDIKSVFWNRCYEPWSISRDMEIRKYLEYKGIQVKSSNGSLLWEPWEIKKEDSTPYRVFTPFYRRGCLNAKAPREPLLQPINTKSFFTDPNNKGLVLFKKTYSSILNSETISIPFIVGESEAQKKLDIFLKKGLPCYKKGRDLLSYSFVSRLSAYLHFGEISPHQIWTKIIKEGDDENTKHFCSELGWREFSYNQLYYNPTLPDKNLRSEFNSFPWQNDNVKLSLWKRGLTGIPIVDAGMRELLMTGYMHNRARMVTASFLVKNLLQDWRYGEKWFWERLVDADLANNSASWQWVSGSGSDAAPYFRIFNPVLQGKKFDPEGSYIRQYVPEIGSLPNQYIFSPWEASKDILESYGVKIGVTYPQPIVDLYESRKKALEAFQSLKN